MWIACDRDCTDSLGHTWEADVPQEVSTEDGASLLAIPGGGFRPSEPPAASTEPDTDGEEPSGEGPGPEPEPVPKPARRKSAPKEPPSA